MADPRGFAMVTGQGLRARVVLLVALATLVLGYLGQRWWAIRGGGMVSASPMSILLLAFMGGGVFASGLPIRRWQRDRSRPPVNPMRALRTLVLAQACAITGALVTGWYLAQVLVLAPDLDAASVRDRALVAAMVPVAGVGLCVIGLWVQSVCRIEPPDADDTDPDDGLPDAEAY